MREKRGNKKRKEVGRREGGRKRPREEGKEEERRKKGTYNTYKDNI